jgi:hypothetical protein
MINIKEILFTMTIPAYSSFTLTSNCIEQFSVLEDQFVQVQNNIVDEL